MKTAYELKVILIAIAGMLIVSCSGTRNANSGSASDRTGANGATNGTGKAPTDNTHNYGN